ncbi:MAG: LPS-assembly protein LptD [Paucimonas sp.]|nr:LPS-assembly protein LptD [Paucimonas sp.]
MTWLTASPNPPFRLRALVVAITAACAAVSASAQTNDRRQLAEEKDLPVVIEAGRMTGRPDREVTLEQDVEITRGETRITSDKATYRMVEDQVEASGNLRMQRFGDEYCGDELKLRVEAMRGYVTNPSYRLEKNNANGRAQRIDFEGEDQATIIQGTYSTCNAPDPDWYLKADTLHLDNGRDIGQAGKTVLYFKGVPIIGAPGMSFPLSDARKSGVLPPTFGTTNQGGFDLTVPYYFNIAPNRDLTVFPNLIARRGLQLGMQALYLGETYSGDVRTEVLPNDRQAAGANRYALSATHFQALTSRLAWSLNVNKASDDDYPNDMPRTITGASQRLLPRDMSLTYSASYWNAAARVSSFQLLQDPAAPIVRPYARLPELTFNAGKQEVRGFDWAFNAEATRFWHPDFVRGNRVVMTPRLAYPVIRQGYFVTPKVTFDYTRYALDNPAPGAPDRLTRSVPILSLDSGLTFERDAKYFGESMTQTLEPRLFYVRAPYRDQKDYPLFDTALADLSFAQLFSENRFIGHDRIGDANHWTAALVSRYIDRDGAEKVRLALAQRFYSSPERVAIGSVNTENRSDLLLSASGALSKTLSAESNLQYSESTRTLNRANAGIRWQPAPKRVLNLFYRRDLLNNLEQFDTSAQWPLAKRWYGVGRINYSLKDRKVVEGLLGTEYKADCWVFRIVAQRIPTALQKATSALFFQLEFNGLARLGSNPLDALRNSIPGYQQINQP